MCQAQSHFLKFELLTLTVIYLKLLVDVVFCLLWSVSWLCCCCCDCSCDCCWRVWSVGNWWIASADNFRVGLSTETTSDDIMLMDLTEERNRMRRIYARGYQSNYSYSYRRESQTISDWLILKRVIFPTSTSIGNEWYIHLYQFDRPKLRAGGRQGEREREREKRR